MPTRKSKGLSLQVEPNFRKALDRAADRARMSRSEYVRRSVAYAIRNDAIAPARPLLPESDD